MIVMINENQVQDVLDFIGPNYKSCLYLYLNLIKYGTNNPEVKTYVDRSDEDIIRAVYLQYYDCLHFYCEENEYPITEIIGMIRRITPKTIFMPINWGDVLSSELDKLDFERTNMTVVTAPRKLCHTTVQTERIGIREIDELTQFLMTDDAYSKIYNQEILSEQLHDRFNSNYSRYHIIRLNNRIVASYGTNAELNNIALMGSLLVANELRGRGYGSSMISCVWNELLAEGKECFAFIENPVSMKLHTRLGCSPCAHITKYYLRKEKSKVFDEE